MTKVYANMLSKRRTEKTMIPENPTFRECFCMFHEILKTKSVSFMPRIVIPKGVNTSEKDGELSFGIALYDQLV